MANSAQDVRYAFNCEWYDPNASIIRRFQFLFYPKDNSIEMYDLKNRRLFLKRQRSDVFLEDLYVGSTINVQSRTLNLTDYADEFTRKSLASVKEKSLGMIKPDAIKNFGSIFDMAYQKGFNIVNAKMTRMNRSIAQEFYAEHVQKPFYHKLVDFMTGGHVIGMELIGNNGIAEWRELLGPTDSSMARSDAPFSIRANFGTDNTRNACHGSDSCRSADREIEIFFRQENKNTARFNDPDYTCCIIKPSAVKQGVAGKIMKEICDAGFEVMALEMFHIEKANAEEFLEVYKGVVAEYMNMVEELHSGPCYALQIRNPSGNTYQTFRDFVGPADPEIARQLRKNTLRAKFGKNKVNNAVHCTDLPEDCELETEYFFKILSN